MLTCETFEEHFDSSPDMKGRKMRINVLYEYWSQGLRHFAPGGEEVDNDDLVIHQDVL